MIFFVRYSSCEAGLTEGLPPTSYPVLIGCRVACRVARYFASPKAYYPPTGNRNENTMDSDQWRTTLGLAARILGALVLADVGGLCPSTKTTGQSTMRASDERLVKQQKQLFVGSQPFASKICTFNSSINSLFSVPRLPQFMNTAENLRFDNAEIMVKGCFPVRPVQHVCLFCDD